MKNVHNIKHSNSGQFCFEQCRGGNSTVVGREDKDESSIEQVSVRASSPVSCTAVVITFVTSGDDCGPNIHSTIVRDTSP